MPKLGAVRAIRLFLVPITSGVRHVWRVDVLLAPSVLSLLAGRTLIAAIHFLYDGLQVLLQ
eukprot:11714667-Alexandrium_andersonii.AAC.1